MLARITVKEGMVKEYLEIAEAADRAVEKTEEGMLFHNFDRDPDDQHICLDEVYRKTCFLFHRTTLLFKSTWKSIRSSTHFSIEIYGKVSNEVIQKINSLESILRQHHMLGQIGSFRNY